MKVLTITTSYANNYGALLQCYALSHYLNQQQGIECEVIQYYRPNANNSWEIVRTPQCMRDVLRNLYVLAHFKMVYAIKRKNEKMRQFINNFIPLTKESWHTPEEIRHNPPQADAYICGSDQIWNMKYLFKGKTVYFLDFVREGKRIAYAPSIADPWQEEHIRMLSPHLSKFDAISIREKGNLGQVQQIFPEATVTIDPVFLLSRENWTSFANTSLCPKEPYILCYFLSVTDFAVKAVKKIRELTGLKVVHLNLNALDKFNSDYNIKVADPRDFVGLIANATYLCTNSFHCSAFSVIFRKNFVFIPKNMANERVINLQNLFKLGDICLNENKLATLTKEKLAIDYTNGTASSEAFIRYSKEFLNKALYE